MLLFSFIKTLSFDKFLKINTRACIYLLLLEIWHFNTFPVVSMYSNNIELGKQNLFREYLLLEFSKNDFEIP